MKKIIFILVVIPFFGYSQKEYTVDRITGFKSILLGNNLSNYEKNLKFIRDYGEYSVYNYDNEISQELLYFFGKKVKAIRLTFDNSTSRLTTIFLDFSENYNVNHLTILPSELEKLYKDISAEIGPASSPKSINSASFYPLSIKGEILWIGNNIVLKVITGSEANLNFDGTSYLMKNESISFISKDTWNN